MKTYISKAEAVSSRAGSALIPQGSRELASASPEVNVLDPTISQYGSVAELNEGAGSFFTLNFIGATTGDRTFVIGDPNELVAGASGLTLAEPNSGSVAPAAIKKQFQNPYLLLGVNYQVKNSAAQFSKGFKYAMANVSGGFGSNPINVFGAQRNTQQNDKLLTIKFERGIRLDSTHALLLTVGQGEEVTMSFYIGAFTS